METNVLPCGCGRLCDWCASWRGAPSFGAAHLQGLAWTTEGWPTPGLQPYSFPVQIYKQVFKIAYRKTCSRFFFREKNNFKMYTLSLEEPTAKQLSRTSRELTTNLKSKKSINKSFHLHLKVTSQSSQTDLISTGCNQCCSKCEYIKCKEMLETSKSIIVW